MEGGHGSDVDGAMCRCVVLHLENNASGPDGTVRLKDFANDVILAGQRTEFEQ